MTTTTSAPPDATPTAYDPRPEMVGAVVRMALGVLVLGTVAALMWPRPTIVAAAVVAYGGTRWGLTMLHPVSRAKGWGAALGAVLVVAVAVLVPAFGGPFRWAELMDVVEGLLTVLQT